MAESFKLGFAARLRRSTNQSTYYLNNKYSFSTAKYNRNNLLRFLYSIF